MRSSKLQQLEIVRGLAAIYVMAGHMVLTQPVPPSAIVTTIFRFGQEAVMCFFLISGFVIYYSTKGHKDQSFRSYFRWRALRIFPIFVLALALAYLKQLTTGDNSLHGRDLVGNLLMLQDGPVKPGTWFAPFCQNSPLWSLSYEWWFYMMFFPIYSWVGEGSQLLVVAAISLIGLGSYVVLPNQISLFLLYFILWWSGVELARTYRRGEHPTFSTQRSSIAILGTFCILIGIGMFLLMPKPSQFSWGLHPILELRHFTACLLLLCLGLVWSHCRWKYFNRILGLFSAFAPISYAVYAFHVPICVNPQYLTGLPTSAKIALTVFLTLSLAYLAELPMQKRIQSLFRPRELPPADSIALPK